MAFQKIKKSKYNLSEHEQKKCHTIIHTSSAAAATVGAGLAQLPLADNTVITPIQITMIISLGKVFDQTITKTIAKGLLGGFVANIVGRSVAQVTWGWIPGIGNASNAITAAAITESIGWLCVDHFYKLKYLPAPTTPVTESDTDTDVPEKMSRAEDEACTEMISLAKEFLNGNKTPKVHREEFNQLLDDMTEYLKNIDNTQDEIYQLQQELFKLL